MRAVDLVEHFQVRLRSVAGVDHGPLPAGSVPDLIRDLLDDAPPGEVMMWDELVTAGIPDGGRRRLETEVPTEANARRSHQSRYESVAVGITGADAGLAESGSIVLRTGQGRSRLASLIPVVHIALLPVSRLYRSWSHYVAEHPAAPSGVSNLTVITGPSRTGDIEQVLTLGVHGPQRLHVILIQ
jgi:L-lactate dehydrogenase complex protein LldG